MIYLKAIRKVEGTKASAVPLYLPPDENADEQGLEKNVFFGAISMYLREKVPFFRHMPAFMDRVVDSAPMLRMAAKRAGTTRTEGLEEMTLGMINGSNAFPEMELRRLVNHLTRDGHPDVIHLSNALIIGLAGQLKKKMDVKIVCSLLNEDDWINEMAEPYQSRAWKLIGEESVNVDAFITPSRYYKEFFVSKTGVPPDAVSIVPLGLDPGSLISIQKKNTVPSLGYFCRINSHNGFDKIVDAFIEIRKSGLIPDLMLHVSGGYTGDDKPFIQKQIAKLKRNGLIDSVKIYSEFQGDSKDDFFSNVDIVSVPVRKYDGYGLHLLEANAAGIPLVEPATGAYPEIIAITGGGITYEPDTIPALAEAIVKLFGDRKLIQDLGIRGKENVTRELSLEKMSKGLSAVYKKLE
jgi:glycosyltransferase involved in cell wall biosynthesis